jgi:hypothetical protein
MASFTFVLNHDGSVNVPYVNEDGGKEYVNWNWLDNDFCDNNPAMLSATLFVISSAPHGRKFVSGSDCATHRAFARFHQVFSTVQYIFCYLEILFPTVSAEGLLSCRPCVLQCGQREVFRHAQEK